MKRNTWIQTAGRVATALLMAAGLAFSIGCVEFTARDCSMGDVDVSGSATRHSYKYSFDCGGDYRGRVSGAYSITTHVAEERVTNDRGELRATWVCPVDPWIESTTACGRDRVSATYDDRGVSVSQDPRTPFATLGLSDAHRRVLRAQLDNALRATVTPTPRPASQSTSASTSISAAAAAVRPAPPEPAKPDLAVTRVSGPTEVFDGATAVYDIALWNEGTPAQGTARLLIGFLGGLQPVAMVDTPAGFTCTRSGPGFSCTGSLGGVDDAVQSRGAVFTVRARAGAKGSASVYGSANHDRTLDEVRVDNNLEQLSVTVK